MASGFLASEFLCNGFNDLDIVTSITCKLKCGKQRWYGVFFMMICMSKNQENSAWLTSITYWPAAATEHTDFFFPSFVIQHFLMVLKSIKQAS